jgi:aminoglycoside phosphotransferase (APT) family kinase protein
MSVGLDVEALHRFLERMVPQYAGTVEAVVLHGGRSNLTYAVTDGVHRWVLRRPPLGTLTPSAHDVGREYRVVEALGRAGVPVPQAIVSCPDAGVLGVPFTVMSFVDGTVLRDGDDAACLSHVDAQRCANELVDTLAAVHSLSPTGIGLGDFGRPDGYLRRQVRRWRDQWARVATRDLPMLDELHARLTRTVPEDSANTVVHGDYRLDNVILRGDDPGVIAAVVDWEMATLGDPLADLGLLLVYWDPVCEPVLGVRHAPTANPGFPKADDLVERYSLASGRDVSRLAVHQALGYFKLAVIAEGIHHRFLDGATVGPGFETVGSAVPELLRAGVDLLRKEDA